MVTTFMMQVYASLDQHQHLYLPHKYIPSDYILKLEIIPKITLI